MDETVTLKDGMQARIKTWDLEDIRSFTRDNLDAVIVRNGGLHVYEGFRFLRPSLPAEIERTDPRNRYEEELYISPLEHQEDGSGPKENYHRALAGTIDGTVVGVFLCQWAKFSSGFWHYHARFLDVHEDHKNKGIGTVLVKALDQSDFIKGKILYIGRYSEEGREHIEHVIDREMSGEDYALVHHDYIGNTPRRYGVYKGIDLF